MSNVNIFIILYQNVKY